MLFGLFPGLEELSSGGYYVRFYAKTLPPKPWPRKVAGVFAYITSDERELGPEPRTDRASRGLIRMHHDIDLRDKATEFPRLFGLIYNFFEGQRIPITEVQYRGRFTMMVLEDEDTGLMKVMRSVARVPCYYLFELELDRAHGLPAGRIEPTATIHDDSSYQNLRPGIIVNGGSQFSTAGVLLEDEFGDRMFSVASHGFSGTSPEVMHPTYNGRCIGNIARPFPNTDVSLAHLQPGDVFSNENFESPYQTQKPGPLNRLLRAADIKKNDRVFMNSAFTGLTDGTTGEGPLAFTRPPHQPNAAKHGWIPTQWNYMGQGSAEQYVNGSNGSVIWNEDGKIISFFRYAPQKLSFEDWCQGMTCDFLIDGKFTIVPVTYVVRCFSPILVFFFFVFVLRTGAFVILI